MRMNELQPAAGSHKAKRRVGRGLDPVLVRPRRAGRKAKKRVPVVEFDLVFEGGQLPLQMRIPKFGFRSRVALSTAEVRLSELAKVQGETISLETLKQANVVRRDMKRVRIMLSGEIARAVTVDDANIVVTKGAKAAIEAAGGSVVAADAGQAEKKTAKAKTAEEPAQAETEAPADDADEESSDGAE